MPNGGFKKEGKKERGTEDLSAWWSSRQDCTAKEAVHSKQLKCHHRIILLDAHKRYDDLETFGVAQTCAGGRGTQKVYFSWQTERALFCICIHYLTQAISHASHRWRSCRKKGGSGLHLTCVCDAYASKHMIIQVFLDLVKTSGYSETKAVGSASERVCVAQCLDWISGHVSAK